MGYNHFKGIYSSVILVGNKILDYREKRTNDKVNQYYHIQDPDGYSILRGSPNGKIIRKVYPNEPFTIIDSLDSFMNVKFSDGSVGYIYKSRVVKR